MPPGASTTYNRYRAGTQRLLKWLKVNAPSLGRASTPSSTLENTRVATHELVPLARSVAAANVEITLDIMYVTKDIIIGRRKCVDWFRDLAMDNKVAPEVLQSNHTHQYFLEQLQEVYEVLSQKYRSSQPKSNDNTNKLDADIQGMNNSFQCLQVEDTSEDVSQDAPTKATPGPLKDVSTENKVKTPEYQLDDGKEEKSFAIFCLMEDFANIRLHICKVWKSYKHGDLSFFTACSLTNFAFDMLATTAESFRKTNADLKSFESIVETSGLTEYLTNTRRAQWSYHNDTADDPNCNSGVRTDPMCMQAWAALRDFKDVTPWLLTTKAEKQRVGAPIIRFPGHPFNKMLIGLAGELVTSLSTFTATPSDKQKVYALTMDLFTLRLSGFISPSVKLMPIELVGMTSVYMGIYDVLEGDMEQGIKECDRIHSRISDACAACIKFLAGRHERNLKTVTKPIEIVLARIPREPDH